MKSTIRWMGLPLFSQGEDELEAKVMHHLDRETNKILTIGTPNPEQIMLAQSNQSFFSALSSMDLLLPDGVGLTFSAKLAGLQINRIPGRVFVVRLLERCADRRIPVLFLGGQAGVAERAKTQVQLVLPRIPVFALQGPVDSARSTPEDTRKILELIKEFEIRVVFVAFGAPKQELWIQEHASELEKSGVRCVMTIGGALDVLAGEVSQPPVLISSLGIEWFWRLLKQPWRLTRQLALVPFTFYACKEVLRSRSSR